MMTLKKNMQWKDLTKYFKNNYIGNIDCKKINEYGSDYTYAGNTELEIMNNQIEIGLGLYMKEKYIEYKKYKEGE